MTDSGSSSSISSPPEDLLCPITGEVMEDPVMVVTGFSYERRAIEAWFARGGTLCPSSGTKLDNLALMPNITLKKAILSWNEGSRCETLPERHTTASEPAAEEHPLVLGDQAPTELPADDFAVQKSDKCASEAEVTDNRRYDSATSEPALTPADDRQRKGKAPALPAELPVRDSGQDILFKRTLALIHRQTATKTKGVGGEVREVQYARITNKNSDRDSRTPCSAALGEIANKDLYQPLLSPAEDSDDECGKLFPDAKPAGAPCPDGEVRGKRSEATEAAGVPQPRSRLRSRCALACCLLVAAVLAFAVAFVIQLLQLLSATIATQSVVAHVEDDCFSACGGPAHGTGGGPPCGINATIVANLSNVSSSHATYRVDRSVCSLEVEWKARYELAGAAGGTFREQLGEVVFSSSTIASSAKHVTMVAKLRETNYTLLGRLLSFEGANTGAYVARSLRTTCRVHHQITFPLRMFSFAVPTRTRFHTRLGDFGESTLEHWAQQLVATSLELLAGNGLFGEWDPMLVKSILDAEPGMETAAATKYGNVTVRYAPSTGAISARGQALRTTIALPAAAHRPIPMPAGIPHRGRFLPVSSSTRIVLHVPEHVYVVRGRGRRQGVPGDGAAEGPGLSGEQGLGGLRSATAGALLATSARAVVSMATANADDSQLTVHVPEVRASLRCMDGSQKISWSEARCVSSKGYGARFTGARQDGNGAASHSGHGVGGASGGPRVGQSPAALAEPSHASETSSAALPRRTLLSNQRPRMGTRPASAPAPASLERDSAPPGLLTVQLVTPSRSFLSGVFGCRHELRARGSIALASDSAVRGGSPRSSAEVALGMHWDGKRALEANATVLVVSDRSNGPDVSVSAGMAYTGAKDRVEIFSMVGKVVSRPGRRAGALLRASRSHKAAPGGGWAAPGAMSDAVTKHITVDVKRGTGTHLATANGTLVVDKSVEDPEGSLHLVMWGHSGAPTVVTGEVALTTSEDESLGRVGGRRDDDETPTGRKYVTGGQGHVHIGAQGGRSEAVMVRGAFSLDRALREAGVDLLVRYNGSDWLSLVAAGSLERSSVQPPLGRPFVPVCDARAGPCNVCPACCKAYLSNGRACLECWQAQCPGSGGVSGSAGARGEGLHTSGFDVHGPLDVAGSSQGEATRVAGHGGANLAYKGAEPVSVNGTVSLSLGRGVKDGEVQLVVRRRASDWLLVEGAIASASAPPPPSCPPAPPPPFVPRCSGACNVCAECCHPYIPNGHSCDECWSTRCAHRGRNPAVQRYSARQLLSRKGTDGHEPDSFSSGHLRIAYKAKELMALQGTLSLMNTALGNGDVARDVAADVAVGYDDNEHQAELSLGVSAAAGVTATRGRVTAQRGHLQLLAANGTLTVDVPGQKGDVAVAVHREGDAKWVTVDGEVSVGPTVAPPPPPAPPPPFTPVCNAKCNVCSACCHPYIHNGPQCMQCWKVECEKVDAEFADGTAWSASGTPRLDPPLARSPLGVTDWTAPAPSTAPISDKHGLLTMLRTAAGSTTGQGRLQVGYRGSQLVALDGFATVDGAAHEGAVELEVRYQGSDWMATSGTLAVVNRSAGHGQVAVDYRGARLLDVGGHVTVRTDAPKGTAGLVVQYKDKKKLFGSGDWSIDGPAGTGSVHLESGGSTLLLLNGTTVVDIKRPHDGNVGTNYMVVYNNSDCMPVFGGVHYDVERQPKSKALHLSLYSADDSMCV